MILNFHHYSTISLLHRDGLVISITMCCKSITMELETILLHRDRLVIHCKKDYNPITIEREK